MMRPRLTAPSLLATVFSVAVTSQFPAHAADKKVPVVANGISGVVTNGKGPEAGVWVIAETKDLGVPFTKIVVTDDQGRYVLPELPKANYKVWVRGYGLLDSKPVQTAPGKKVDLTAVVAPDAKTAAQYYPANYWYALAEPPAADQFPGTGDKGNGISTTMKTQDRWVANMQECLQCHQIGNQTTREFPNNTVEGWDARVKQMRPSGDPSMVTQGKGYSGAMSLIMSHYGRGAGLKMYSDWTRKIAEGAYPTEAPPRPQGVERNVVLTLWEWGRDGSYFHDSVATDRLNPQINANGPIYGILSNKGAVGILDPVKHVYDEVAVPTAEKGFIHTILMDQKKRSWLPDVGPVFQYEPVWDKQPDFCTNGEASKFAKYFPARSPGARYMYLFDPATNKSEKIVSCVGASHVWFGGDRGNTIYLSAEMVGWIDSEAWDATRDPAKSQGWCPMVLDTSAQPAAAGSPAIDPISANWNKPGATPDPNKDTLMLGFGYGLGVSPIDDSVWVAIKDFPGGVVRFERGKNPPETCKSEYYQPPKLPDGNYPAFSPHDSGIDSKGTVYVTFTSGQIARFDRNKCKVTSGPTATGQHCPEGWTMFNAPGPTFKSVSKPVANADYPYQTFVDRFNTFGWGENIPYVPGSNSDSLLGVNPETGKWVTLRVPYPMGMYARWLDGRIDDPKAGWKGRGLWTTYSTVPVWHQEGGVEAQPQVVKFQLRPDPLAH